MTRQEYNEYRYIRSYQNRYRELILGPGTVLTIRTNAGAEYKRKLHDLYTGWGFHPSSIGIDSRFFDDQERIRYIYGLTWKDNNGNDRSWSELYTQSERDRFENALT